MQKLVLASNSADKVREFQELLAPFQFQVIPQGELGIPSAEEPYLTFVENALAKARHASAALATQVPMETMLLTIRNSLRPFKEKQIEALTMLAPWLW